MLTHATPAALEQPPSRSFRAEVQAVFAENKTPKIIRPERKKPIPKTKVVEPISESAIIKMIFKASKKEDINPCLALTVAKIESGFDPNAKSGKGAIGVMQLMPDKAEELGVENPRDAKQNIEGGVQHLADLVEKYGSRKNALIAYNCGEGALQKYLRTNKLPKGAADYLKRFQIAKAELESKS
ncbi:MAG: lytic transglycosylase domain-containing protein [Patescibacteria group bacterium]